jgi:hypothetical protein
MTTYILIHSPLVGPDTWAHVAEALRRAGQAAVVPALPEAVAGGRLFWAEHAEAAARQVPPTQAAEPLILVGHSGAGVLLPAIRQALGRPVQGYIFVDAGLPTPGQSRLASFGQGAAEFRAHLAGGGQFPDWTDDDLKELVPDADRRARLVAGLRPQPLAYWDEPLPVVAGWPDAPGAYLLFSPVYAEAAAEARRLGWPVRQMAGGHFHMLAAPGDVAAALMELSGYSARETQ